MAVTVIVLPGLLSPEELAKLREKHPGVQIVVVDQPQAVSPPGPPDWPEWNKDKGECLRSSYKLGTQQFLRAIEQGVSSFELGGFPGPLGVALRIKGQGEARIVRLAVKAPGREGFYFREMSWGSFEQEYTEATRAWRHKAWARLSDMARKGELRLDFNEARVRRTWGLGCD